MHLSRIIFALAAILAIVLACSGCGGGGGGTTSPIVDLPKPHVDAVANYATFTPTDNSSVNFVTADFISVATKGTTPAQEIKEVPFHYDDASKSWVLSFTGTNHPGITQSAVGQFTMNVYVLLSGETTRRQIGDAYLVNLNILVDGSTPDNGSGGPPTPPWP